MFSLTLVSVNFFYKMLNNFILEQGMLHAFDLKFSFPKTQKQEDVPFKIRKFSSTSGRSGCDISNTLDRSFAYTVRTKICFTYLNQFHINGYCQHVVTHPVYLIQIRNCVCHFLFSHSAVSNQYLAGVQIGCFRQVPQEITTSITCSLCNFFDKT